MGYTIPFDQTRVTFGKRTWYLCPNCQRRCGVLYRSSVLVCRTCLKLTYESQNGSKLDHMGERIRKARKKLWSKSRISILSDDLFESCQWWPKPKGIHHNRFAKEKSKIVSLEKRYVMMAPAQYRHMFSHYRSQ